MDGKGAWRGNVFVERLWRTVKYEEVYLRAYDTVAEAQASIGRYLDLYNAGRPHSQHSGRTGSGLVCQPADSAGGSMTPTRVYWRNGTAG
jgi:putative transposase